MATTIRQTHEVNGALHAAGVSAALYIITSHLGKPFSFDDSDKCLQVGPSLLMKAWELQGVFPGLRVECNPDMAGYSWYFMTTVDGTTSAAYSAGQ